MEWKLRNVGINLIREKLKYPNNRKNIKYDKDSFFSLFENTQPSIQFQSHKQNRR